MFQARFDSDLGRLSLVASGFWSVEEADEATATVRSAASEAAAYAKPITILSDLRGAQIQSAKVAEINMNSMAVLATLSIRKYAVVTSSQLIRLQFKRQAGSDFPLAFFEDLDEAMAWLVTP
ncbi:STAS/SEC14 domain-containing protein [Rhizorhabdus dicambivorans]|uniref:STAS/SEC14 domain-containing protein n=1 Tax=Rhizorhabdus dicambivorans TaxID=1850238 RepID=A0A2A4FNU1_9SPHN|nr:STAS/SEC14 domain-containing protein [Rhizorhabdus dicambivorans]ATE65709.1 STAS/SEC14 domain-containing protein [Rhizorhabdus dicambivorans]PCE40073.1 STAS/SEC14 domain-containing protein [Rhizorhabdus dicambivorans]